MMLSAPNSRIRPVQRHELGKMLRIFSEAIPNAQLSRSIYLAAGAEAFLAKLLEHPRLQWHEQLWGAGLDDGSLVGAAHTRLIGDYQHLNNYAILPEFQGRGIGAHMMAYWHELARSQRVRRLSLDVAVDNAGARRHYAAFGFSDRAQSHEYRLKGSLDLPDTVGVQLQDWPLAMASFQAYGFGRFVLALGMERCSVDLRVEAFRLASFDPRLLAALRAIDPVRQIVVRSADAPPDDGCWDHTGTVVRLEKELT
jgi:ribosomal protein S18 acetylase RimI-like enzyme